MKHLNRASLLIYACCLYTVSSVLSDITLDYPLDSQKGIIIQTTYGAEIAGIGDINGDGIQDFAVKDSKDIVYVMYGSQSFVAMDIDPPPQTMDSTKGFIINVITDPNSDIIVNRLGDMNGDNVDDLIIGDRLTNNFGGAVYIIFGSKTAGFLTDISPADIPNLVANERGFKVEGTSQLGSYVSGGDVNGDGISDAIIGGGTFYILYGSNSPGILTDITAANLPLISSNSRGFLLSGASGIVNYAGDINGDGADDIIVGYEYANSMYGAAYVIYGVKAPGVFADITSNSDFLNLFSSGKGFSIAGEASSYLGHSVSSAGDINGDGVSDIVIGCTSSSSVGTAYVIFGNKTPNSLNNIANTDLPNLYTDGKGFKIKGASTLQLGESSAVIGDVNADGVDDLIVGAKGSPTDTELAYVIYGNKTPGALTNLGPAQLNTLFTDGKGFKITGPAGEYLHMGLSGNVDINNDGGLDILIGNEWQATVIFGIPHSIPTPPSGSSNNPPAPVRSPAMQAIAEGLAKAAQVTTVVTVGTSIISFGNPGLIVLFSSAEAFMALKLLKINYPSRLRDLLENPEPDDTIFTSMLATPEVVVTHVTLQPLPEKFQNAGLYSSFLANFWPSLIPLTGLLVLAIFVSIFKPCTLSKRKGSSAKRALLWT